MNKVTAERETEPKKRKQDREQRRQNNLAKIMTGAGAAP